MKHLKTHKKLFELSENQEYSDIKLYLSEIFIELEHEGYDINIEENWKWTSHWEPKLQRLTTPKELIGFKIKITGKSAKEDVLSAIETSINYMSSRGFNNYWIILQNFGILDLEELSNYFNVQKFLVNFYKRTLELNFSK